MMNNDLIKSFVFAVFNVYVVVNFLSLVILFFLCFSFISIHYHTQKQKTNKKLPETKN